MAWERELDHAGFTLHCAPVDHHSLAGFSLAFRGLATRGPRIWVGFALGLCRVSVEFRDERIASIGEQVLLDVFARGQLSDRRIAFAIDGFSGAWGFGYDCITMPWSAWEYVYNLVVGETVVEPKE